MPVILLVSASERRRAIMADFSEKDGIEVRFSVLKEPEPEPLTNLEVHLQVESSCMHKARSAVLELGYGENSDVEMIVVSDTLVEDPDDSRVALGKPEDKVSAASTLIRLSGRRHKVWSSTAIVTRNGTGLEVGAGWRAEIWTDFSIVEFDEIGVDGMEDLIGSGSWFGKAGGYDLAGKAGSFSRVIEGEDVTVLGFSSCAFEEIGGILL
ncbi:MAG: Maf family protein [Candidatus Thalassarchaeaceae archaeon]|nr:Maf family protein [Candidatus Thalassarchaeaceae archaeon]